MMIDNEKPLVLTERELKQLVEVIVDNKFLEYIDYFRAEQEKEIERLRTTLGQCNTELNSALESLKSQCREIGELRAKVKQAQIDVLNKVKKRARTSYVLDDFILGSVVFSKDIDELIKEVEAK